MGQDSVSESLGGGAHPCVSGRGPERVDRAGTKRRAGSGAGEMELNRRRNGEVSLLERCRGAFQTGLAFRAARIPPERPGVGLLP